MLKLLCENESYTVFILDPTPITLANIVSPDLLVNKLITKHLDDMVLSGKYIAMQPIMDIELYNEYIFFLWKSSYAIDVELKDVMKKYNIEKQIDKVPDYSSVPYITANCLHDLSRVDHTIGAVYKYKDKYFVKGNYLPQYIEFNLNTSNIDTNYLSEHGELIIEKNADNILHTYFN